MLFPKSLKDTLAESSENRSVINRPTDSKYYKNYMWTDTSGETSTTSVQKNTTSEQTSTTSGRRVVRVTRQVIP